MGSTVGNPTVIQMYFYVDLMRKKFLIWIGKKILFPLLPACWHGWNLPHDFYFRMYVVKHLNYSHYLDSQTCSHCTGTCSCSLFLFSLVVPGLLSMPPIWLSPSSWVPTYVVRISPEYYFVPIICPPQCWVSHFTYLLARLLGA